MTRLLSFFIFFFPIYLLAYQPTYVNYTMAVGLPSNTVFCSMQDSKGYLWFGTDKGVARFDGTKFTIFSSSDGMADNIVFDIFEDSKHRIWFSCNNGNACYYYQGKFWNKNNDTILSKLTANSLGLKVLESEDHTIYLLTQFQLFRLSIQNKVDEINVNGFSMFSSMVCNEKGHVIVLANRGLYNTHTHQFRLYPISEYYQPLLYSKAFYFNNQVYFNHNGSISSFNMAETSEEINTIPLTESPNITQCLLIHSDSILFVGTQNAMIRYNLKTQKIEDRSFLGFSISSFTHDFEHNFWMTTLTNGIFLTVNPKVKLLNENSGLIYRYAGFIDKLKDGTIAIGSNKYLASFIVNGQIINLQLPKEAGEGKIEKIRIGHDGNYYLTAGAVTIKVNKQNWQARVIQMSARDVKVISPTQSIVIVGSGVLNLHSNQFEAIYTNKSYINNPKIGFLFPNVKASGIYHHEYSGNIYIYGLFGVKLLKGNKLESILNNHEYLAKNITRVAETNNGLQCFASNIYGVILVYNNKIFTINKTNGLNSNFVNSLYLDAKNQLWVATSEGLCKIKLDLQSNEVHYNVTHYNQKDGLNSKSINDITMDGDTIYVTSDQGINVFREQDLIHTTNQPKVSIESIYINNQPQTIELNYHTNYQNNSLKIKFVGISYHSFGKIKYKYRMRGLENDWRYTENSILEFPALPFGKFVFELIAINADGAASNVVAFQITVDPPYWKSWWFILVMSIGGILIFAAFLRYRIKAIQKNHETREQLLQLKNLNFEAEKKQAIYEREILDIQNQALRLHMNPHFIFNSINSIQGFYASGEVSMAKKYIGKFSTLLRMILDQSKKDLIDINDEVTTIEYYLELNKLRFENKFEFEINADKILLQNREELPPMIIQPFIENAIIHGLAPLKKMGKIIVRLIDAGSYIQCEIEDNGVGRAFSEKLHKNKNYESTGIRVTEKRIELHNKSAPPGTVPPLIISDILDSEGHIAGTLVTFSLLKCSV